MKVSIVFFVWLLLLSSACKTDLAQEPIVIGVRQIVVLKWPTDSLDPAYSWTADTNHQKKTTVYFVVDSSYDTLSGPLEDTLDQLACQYIEDKKLNKYSIFSLIYVKRTERSDRLDTVRNGISDRVNPEHLISDMYVKYRWIDGVFSKKQYSGHVINTMPMSCWDGPVQFPPFQMNFREQPGDTSEIEYVQPGLESESQND